MDSALKTAWFWLPISIGLILVLAFAWMWLRDEATRTRRDHDPGGQDGVGGPMLEGEAVIDVRKHDEERIMQTLKRVAERYPEASRAVATVAELADLICDIRHETIANMTERVRETMVLAANGAMTSRRLRRLMADPIETMVCIVCKQPVIHNAPREDRWSWGPDGAHCHKRCEAGFWDALRGRATEASGEPGKETE
jgi:hypothetical protein